MPVARLGTSPAGPQALEVPYGGGSLSPGPWN